MNARQQRILVSYRNSLAALRRFGSALGPEAPPIAERLERTIAEIDAVHVQQLLSRKTLTVASARRQLEKVRHDQMLPLARLTRRIFAGERAIQAALRVPHKRAPTETLLKGATHMVATLRPHRSLLVASHIDPARLNELQRDVRELRKAFRVAQASVADRAVPTRRLGPLFASAHLDFLALDALVATSFTGVAAHAWKASRRITKRMGRPRAKRKAPDRQAVA